MATLIIGAIVLGWIAYIAVNTVKKIKRGESSCGGGCAGCSSSKSCCSRIKLEK